jgi:hypothetical protein
MRLSTSENAMMWRRSFIVLGPIWFWLLLSLVACRTAGKSQQFDFTFSGVQSVPTSATGDCNQIDTVISGINYSGSVRGDLKGDANLVLLVRQSRGDCTTGFASGAWLIHEPDNSVLEGTFRSPVKVSFDADPASWAAATIVLTVTDASGRFSKAFGVGSCDAKGILATDRTAVGEMGAACKLTLTFSK